MNRAHDTMVWWFIKSIPLILLGFFAWILYLRWSHK